MDSSGDPVAIAILYLLALLLIASCVAFAVGVRWLAKRDEVDPGISSALEGLHPPDEIVPPAGGTPGTARH